MGERGIDFEDEVAGNGGQDGLSKVWPEIPDQTDVSPDPVPRPYRPYQQAGSAGTNDSELRTGDSALMRRLYAQSSELGGNGYSGAQAGVTESQTSSGVDVGETQETLGQHYRRLTESLRGNPMDSWGLAEEELPPDGGLLRGKGDVRILDPADQIQPDPATAVRPGVVAEAESGPTVVVASSGNEESARVGRVENAEGWVQVEGEFQNLSNKAGDGVKSLQTLIELAKEGRAKEDGPGSASFDNNVESLRQEIVKLNGLRLAAVSLEGESAELASTLDKWQRRIDSLWEQFDQVKQQGDEIAWSQKVGANASESVAVAGQPVEVEVGSEPGGPVEVEQTEEAQELQRSVEVVKGMISQWLGRSPQMSSQVFSKYENMAAINRTTEQFLNDYASKNNGDKVSANAWRDVLQRLEHDYMTMGGNEQLPTLYPETASGQPSAAAKATPEHEEAPVADMPEPEPEDDGSAVNDPAPVQPVASPGVGDPDVIGDGEVGEAAREGASSVASADKGRAEIDPEIWKNFYDDTKLLLENIRPIQTEVVDLEHKIQGVGNEEIGTLTSRLSSAKSEIADLVKRLDAQEDTYHKQFEARIPDNKSQEGWENLFSEWSTLLESAAVKINDLDGILQKKAAARSVNVGSGYEDRANSSVESSSERFDREWQDFIEEYEGMQKLRGELGEQLAAIEKRLDAYRVAYPVRGDRPSLEKFNTELTDTIAKIEALTPRWQNFITKFGELRSRIASPERAAEWTHYLTEQGIDFGAGVAVGLTRGEQLKKWVDGRLAQLEDPETEKDREIVRLTQKVDELEQRLVAVERYNLIGKIDRSVREFHDSFSAANAEGGRALGRSAGELVARNRQRINNLKINGTALVSDLQELVGDFSREQLAEAQSIGHELLSMPPSIAQGLRNFQVYYHDIERQKLDIERQKLENRQQRAQQKRDDLAQRVAQRRQRADELPVQARARRNPDNRFRRPDEEGSQP